MRVILAVDSSEHSVDAARAAHRLFGDDAEYLAVNVSEAAAPWLPAGSAWGVAYAWAPPFWGAAPHDPGMLEGAEETAQRTAAGVAVEAGVEEATAVGDVGDPVTAILAEAEAHGADVIVVGSHTRAWWERLLGPSISSGIMKESTRPVLVVPEPPAQDG